MKAHLSLVFWILLLMHFPAGAQMPDYQRWAADWLYNARTGAPTDSLRSLLANAHETALRQALPNDAARKTFWINIYNAATQTELKAHPERYQNRNKFFKSKLVTIAGKPLSLDDIEHGILRRSKSKWSLGYFNKLFKSDFEKAFRVDTLDYRIHFALNCGARSCPPIAYYTVGEIDAQLESATKGHLRAETDYDSVHNTAAVTAFMGWFRGDFGGKEGIRKLLRKTGVIPESASPKIRFKKYDWNLYLANFKED